MRSIRQRIVDCGFERCADMGSCTTLELSCPDDLVVLSLFCKDFHRQDVETRLTSKGVTSY